MKLFTVLNIYIQSVSEEYYEYPSMAVDIAD